MTQNNSFWELQKSSHLFKRNAMDKTIKEKNTHFSDISLAKRYFIDITVKVSQIFEL